MSQVHLKEALWRQRKKPENIVKRSMLSLSQRQELKQLESRLAERA